MGGFYVNFAPMMGAFIAIRVAGRTYVTNSRASTAPQGLVEFDRQDSKIPDANIQHLLKDAVRERLNY